MIASAESALSSELLQVAGPVLFLIFAGLAAIGGIAAVLARNIVRMAVSLLFALFAISMLYFYVGVEFLGAIQLIVYVGGTLILIVFGIMLTGRSLVESASASRPQQVLGAVIALGIVSATIALSLAIVRSPVFVLPAVTEANVIVQPPMLANAVPADLQAASVEEAGPWEPSVEDFGRALVTRFVLPFEVAGLLLLVVMVGAAYIAKRRHGESPLKLAVLGPNPLHPVVHQAKRTSDEEIRSKG